MPLVTSPRSWSLDAVLDHVVDGYPQDSEHKREDDRRQNGLHLLGKEPTYGVHRHLLVTHVFDTHGQSDHDKQSHLDDVSRTVQGVVQVTPEGRIDHSHHQEPDSNGPPVSEPSIDGLDEPLDAVGDLAQNGGGNVPSPSGGCPCPLTCIPPVCPVDPGPDGPGSTDATIKLDYQMLLRRVLCDQLLCPRKNGSGVQLASVPIRPGRMTGSQCSAPLSPLIVGQLDDLGAQRRRTLGDRRPIQTPVLLSGDSSRCL